MSINIDKRTCHDILDFQPEQKKVKMEPVFPQERVQHPSDFLYHRYRHIPCLKKNAVYVENSPLHANKIIVTNSKMEFVAGQAPLKEDRSKFWKAVYDGDYTIIDLTTKKDQHKRDDESLGVIPYYPEAFNEDYQLDFHTLRLDSDDGLLKKYSVKDHQTGKVKELKRIPFSLWPEYKVISVETLAHLVNIIALYGNNKIWVHCRDGVDRAVVVIAGALLKEKIFNGEIHSENLTEALEQLVNEVKNQRLKSFSDVDQKPLLLSYAKSLLKDKT